ncbi:hypothetical protein BC827DRAFT_567449 [Russula dissimulans]|nr:hypothetical protein BC827DRAFT_567449 [Russula dissimulans]
MAAVAAAAVVDRRHPLLALAQPIRDNPCCSYIEVSDDLLCGIFLVYCNVAVEHLNVDLGDAFAKGYMTTVHTPRLPRRLFLTANCYHYGDQDWKWNKFTFIVDVLLVPLSFNAQTCFDLYLEPFNPQSRPAYMGTRRLRDNIILLRKFAVQGEFFTCAVDQFDIPEDLRNRLDYRLVITCPVVNNFSGCTDRGLFFQLEMEF